MAKVELTLKEYDELKMYKDIVDELLTIKFNDWHLQQYLTGGLSYLIFESDFANSCTKSMRDMIFNKVNAQVDNLIAEHGFTKLDKKITEWDVIPRISFDICSKLEEE